MKVKFYGTRGSTPVSGEEYTRFGGSTTCLSVRLDDGMSVIFDAGTGIRRLGAELMKRPEGRPELIAIVLTHTHWDHIQGFPFFAPAYTPGTKIIIGICGKGLIPKGGLRSIFAAQMQEDYFPVPLEKMGAEFDFMQPDASDYTGPLGDNWRLRKHNHPGGAYSYRFEADGKAFVFCTDIEHGERLDERIVELAEGADILIHDGQYTPEELEGKRGWGHSSWVQAVEVAERAGVKRLAVTHHDPDHDDEFLLEVEKECRERFPGAFLAREGLGIDL
ncbi:MAG: MBL fold metallo-hydrolase [Elusimicrobiota bacterium]